MNYYEQIRAACIKNDPSILDPKIGCLLFDGEEEDPEKAKLTEMIVGYNEDTGYYYVTLLDINNNVISERGVIYQEDVYGRHITLQDVLRVLGDDIVISSSGTFWRMDDECQCYRSAKMSNKDFPRFDMSKSLQDQPEEVLKFISENITQ